MISVTADDLYSFIRDRAEEVDGQIVCRASLIEELVRRGVPASRQQQLRIRLVKELEARGLIKRPHPRSRRLVLLEPQVPERLRRIAHEQFADRISAGIEPGGIEWCSPCSPEYGFDAHASAKRIDLLEKYMASQVLSSKEFVCANGSHCKSSMEAGCTFTEGQLSHVGKHFDLTRDGRDLRVVIVGQEAGAKGRARTTMPERYARILGLKHKQRSPHMRGTILALHSIFGSCGRDLANEFIEIDGGRVHVFDCFALVNRLLCSSHLKGTSNGKPTSTMFTNCERHFRKTLEILGPTLVVIQGIKVWKSSQDVLKPIKSLSKNLHQCDLAGRRVIVAAFTHPSARGPNRWNSPKSPYFREVVRPNLETALASLVTE